MKHIGRTAVCKEGYGDEFEGMKKAGKRTIQVRNVGIYYVVLKYCPCTN